MTTPGIPSEVTRTQVFRARAAVFAMFFTNGCLFANIVPRLPEIKQTFGLSDFAYGWVVILFTVGALLFGPFAGAMMRRLTSRVTAATCTAAIGVLLSAAAFAVHAGQQAGESAGTGIAPTGYLIAFGVLYFLAGSWDAITDVAQNAHGLRVQRHYRRSIITAFHGGWTVGAAAGGLMGIAAVSAGLPIHIHLAIAAVLNVIVSAVAAIFGLHGRDEDDPGLGSAEDGGRQKMRTVRIPAVVALVLLTVLSLSGTLAEDANSTWSTLYMGRELGVSAGLAGTAFVAFLVGQAIGRFTSDALIDRVGARQTVLAGGVLTVVGMGAALAFPSVPLTLVGMALAGFGNAALVPVAMNAADDLPGLKAGTGLTVVTWLMRCAGLISPPVVGAIVERTSLTVAMAVIPLAGLLAVLTAFVLAPREDVTARG